MGVQYSLAPLMGGAIESVVTVTKKPLKVTINNHVLIEETRVTLLAKLSLLLTAVHLLL